MENFIPGFESYSLNVLGYNRESNADAMYDAMVAMNDVSEDIDAMYCHVHMCAKSITDLTRINAYLASGGPFAAVESLVDVPSYTGNFIYGAEGLGEALKRAWDFIIAQIKKIGGFFRKLFSSSSESISNAEAAVDKSIQKAQQVSGDAIAAAQELPPDVTADELKAFNKAVAAGNVDDATVSEASDFMMSKNFSKLGALVRRVVGNISAKHDANADFSKIQVYDKKVYSDVLATYTKIIEAADKVTEQAKSVMMGKKVGALVTTAGADSTVSNLSEIEKHIGQFKLTGKTTTINGASSLKELLSKGGRDALITTLESTKGFLGKLKENKAEEAMNKMTAALEELGKKLEAAANNTRTEFTPSFGDKDTAAQKARKVSDAADRSKAGIARQGLLNDAKKTVMEGTKTCKALKEAYANSLGLVRANLQAINGYLNRAVELAKIDIGHKEEPDTAAKYAQYSS